MSFFPPPDLYFKTNLKIQDFMFLVIWVAKVHANPWFRRDLHLKHHILSGQKNDAEERLIGLGLPFGLCRMAVTLHPFGSILVIPPVEADTPWLDVKKMNLSSMPVATLYFALSKLFFLYAGVLIAFERELPHWQVVRALGVCLILPNILRQSCLVCVSNCSHYFGDIPEKSVFYQNQILDHWIMLPLNCLCMNFGATHIVHHYVPGQPFYLRNMVYPKVRDFMIENGVRNNDLGIVARANRYYSNTKGGAGCEASADPTVATPEREIAPNNTGLGGMVCWLGIMFVTAPLTIILFDSWVGYAFSKRMFNKYVRGRSVRREAKEAL